MERTVYPVYLNRLEDHESPAGRWPPTEDTCGWEEAASADSASEGGNPAWARAPLGTPPPGSSPGTFVRGRGAAPKADSGGGDGTRRKCSSTSQAVYSPVVHCGSIRQAAHVLAMSELLDGASALGTLQPARSVSCSSARTHTFGRALASNLHP